jgi:hypothetical protein
MVGLLLLLVVLQECVAYELEPLPVPFCAPRTRGIRSVTAGSELPSWCVGSVVCSRFPLEGEARLAWESWQDEFAPHWQWRNSRWGVGGLEDGSLRHYADGFALPPSDGRLSLPELNETVMAMGQWMMEVAWPTAQAWRAARTVRQDAPGGADNSSAPMHPMRTGVSRTWMHQWFARVAAKRRQAAVPAGQAFGGPVGSFVAVQLRIADDWAPLFVEEVWNNATTSLVAQQVVRRGGPRNMAIFEVDANGNERILSNVRPGQSIRLQTTVGSVLRVRQGYEGPAPGTKVGKSSALLMDARGRAVDQAAANANGKWQGRVIPAGVRDGGWRGHVVWEVLVTTIPRDMNGMLVVEHCRPRTLGRNGEQFALRAGRGGGWSLSLDRPVRPRVATSYSVSIGEHLSALHHGVSENVTLSPWRRCSQHGHHVCPICGGRGLVSTGRPPHNASECSFVHKEPLGITNVSSGLSSTILPGPVWVGCQEGDPSWLLRGGAMEEHVCPACGGSGVLDALDETEDWGTCTTHGVEREEAGVYQLHLQAGYIPVDSGLTAERTGDEQGGKAPGSVSVRVEELNDGVWLRGFGAAHLDLVENQPVPAMVPESKQWFGGVWGLAGEGVRPTGAPWDVTTRIVLSLDEALKGWERLVGLPSGDCLLLQVSQPLRPGDMIVVPGAGLTVPADLDGFGHTPDVGRSLPARLVRDSPEFNSASSPTSIRALFLPKVRGQELDLSVEEDGDDPEEMLVRRFLRDAVRAAVATDKACVFQVPADGIRKGGCLSASPWGKGLYQWRCNVANVSDESETTGTRLRTIREAEALLMSADELSRAATGVLQIKSNRRARRVWRMETGVQLGWSSIAGAFLDEADHWNTTSGETKPDTQEASVVRNQEDLAALLETQGTMARGASSAQAGSLPRWADAGDVKSVQEQRFAELRSTSWRLASECTVPVQRGQAPPLGSGRELYAAEDYFAQGRPTARWFERPGHVLKPLVFVGGGAGPVLSRRGSALFEVSIVLPHLTSTRHRSAMEQVLD